jgi:hypothetical protein
MILAHYYALVTIAAVTTGAWLFKPEERTAVTTLAAFLGWGLAALTGDSTEQRVDAGAELVNHTNGTTAVAQGEQYVAAPVPDEFRLFMTLFALLSALALLLYVWGVYPPESEANADERMDT